MFRGSSDSASKCIFNLLKAFNLRERNSVIKRVTIIKTRVYEGSGDSSGCGKVKSVTNTTRARLWYWKVLDREEIGWEKDKLESKINPRFVAKKMGWMGWKENNRLMILEVCCGSPIRRNSVLEGLRVR